jgi:CBS domain containing-hemolysin-like protein
MNPLVMIPLAILLAAFFSAMELAFVASNKLRIELDRKQGHFGSGMVSVYTRNPGQYISTMLIGVNIATVIFSMLTADLVEKWLTNAIPAEAVILIVQTVISAIILLVFGDFLPKSVVRINPNFFLNLFAIPTALFYFIFYPVSKFTLWLANVLMRLFFGIKTERGEQENKIFTRIDLDHFVNDLVETEEEKDEESSSLKIFQNVLDFSSIKARECMVPRTEIVAVPADSAVDDLKHQFIESGHSKILLYNENIDNMAGYYELKDILNNPADIVSGMRKLPVVPETMTANRVLRLLSDAKKSIALVVDEFGGTAGVITIEDVLEEIVGDIEDEHDTSDLIEKKINDREYVLSGRLDIDYLNDEYALDLPESDEYTTLAGLILYTCGKIPHQQEVIRIGRYHFIVLRSSATKVELLKLKID